MSGYNSAAVTLARIARAIAACEGARRRGRETAGAVAASASGLAAEIAAARVATPELRASYGGFVARLESLCGEAQRIENAISAVVVPVRSSETTEPAMAQTASQIDRLASEVAQARQGVADVNGQYASTAIADAALASARLSALGIDAALRAQADSLDRWDSETAASLSTEVRGIIQEVQQLAASHSSSADLSAGSETLGARVAALEDAVESMTTRVEELQQAHERRVYILRGLRDVCSRLGFAEVDGPRYESERADSAIVLVVDTKGRGTIAFKVGMDDQIETDSKMDLRYCASEFGRLSDELIAGYGIQSQFSDVDHDAKPKRRTHDAEDQPEGAPAVQSQEW